jgi:NADPH:quinone reductase and related Zn-dependent oxidoreductases
MRAYTMTANTLQSTEHPDLHPGEGQVSIDVQVAGLGMIDALWATGFMPSGDGFVPGLEVAGTVRDLGPSVGAMEVGQPVAAFLPGAGGLAEIALAPASLVAVIPEGLSMDVASVVPSNTVTAHLAMTTVARLTAGESLLINAGMGGLGTQFAEVARVLGAGRIDAVVGTTDKANRARAFGYGNVYLRSELDDVPTDTYDIVVDPVGGNATRHALRVLRMGGRLLKVGNASRSDDVSLSSLTHWLENKTTTGFNVGAHLSAFPDQGSRSLAWALDAVARGLVRVDLTQVGTWDEVPDLLASLLDASTTGKLAVAVHRAH